MNHLEITYQKRSKQFKEIADQLLAKYKRFAFVRVIVFAAGLGLAIFLGTSFGVAIGFLAFVIFLFGFARFVYWHLAIQQANKHHAALKNVNKNEISALKEDTSVFEDGEEFVNPNHPNSVDLDLFGAFSFFQFCNRTSTVIGKYRLAQYLKKTVPAEEILKRQEAVAELKDLLDWRQHFQAYGLGTEDSIEHIQLLKKWLHEPSFVNNAGWLKFAIYATPIWSIVSILLLLIGLPWQLAIFLLIPQGWILKTTLERVNRTHDQTTHAEKILSFYSKLIAHIESHDFKAQKLKALKASFLLNDALTSKKISKLSYIISQLNVRYNPFAILLNLSMLWDLRYVWKLEKWKEELKDDLPVWFDALAEFEALISLATIYYNNPKWVFPKLSDTQKIEAHELGHPLIVSSKRVNNDIDIPTQGHIKLVTGSNMAGKSTFLRTVGLNIVLAMIGAPVCASKMELPMLRVYTSMRTQDALHESTSSFYAELKRLKFIIEAVESGEAAFFLLDEILKGTNSNDRHTGSKALIQQLIKSKGAGIIATHDLELGNLEAKSNGAIENLRMEVEIKNGELFFDYKLKKGVSESFNATLLMKQMGIKIEN